MHLVLLNLRAETLQQKTEYNEARKVNQALVGNFSLASLKSHLDKSKTDTSASIFEAVLALLNIVHIDANTSGHGLCSGTEIWSNLESIRTILSHMAPLYTLFCDITLGYLHLQQRRSNVAHSIFRQCLATTQTQFGDHQEAALLCYQGLGNATGNMNDKYSALNSSILWLLFGLRVQAWSMIHRSLRCLGDVLLSEGDEVTAESLFEVALEGATFSDIHQGL